MKLGSMLGYMVLWSLLQSLKKLILNIVKLLLEVFTQNLMDSLTIEFKCIFSKNIVSLKLGLLLLLRSLSEKV